MKNNTQQLSDGRDISHIIGTKARFFTKLGKIGDEVKRGIYNLLGIEHNIKKGGLVSENNISGVNETIIGGYNDTNSPYCQTLHGSDNCVVSGDSTFMQNNRGDMIACSGV